ncbi:MAG: amidohydrolase family protein [Eubacterium sp.]|nr:amidohydrolase family protein [Eubacterium sp.]
MSKECFLIKNGTVFTGVGRTSSDVLIEDGKIKEVVERGTIAETGIPKENIYDASGKWVLPGLIDPHMHIAAPLGGVIDIMDFDSASRVAAYGGVTTYFDFSSTLPGMSIRKAVSERLKEMSVSKQDYSCHAKVVSLVSPMTAAREAMASAEVFDARQKLEALQKAGKAQEAAEMEPEIASLETKLADADIAVKTEIQSRIDEIPRLIREDKIPTFKLFMTYRKAHVMIDDTDMLKVMKKITECGGMVGFHAESNPIAEFNDELFGKEGHLGPDAFAESKPNICEAEAVGRVLQFAEMLHARIYFFHITTKESVELIRKAKARGVNVTAETCTHYLTLTKDKYKDPDTGRLYMMSPPLRTQADCDALWEAINDGTISIVSSDNCTFTREQKTCSDDYRKIISGTSGLGERLGLLLGEGVAKKRITMQKLVQVASENPAKVFGCYPEKGCLQPGSDADILVLDPSVHKELTAQNLHYPEELTYSIYEGFSSCGWPVLLLRRGEILLQDGIFREESHAGKQVMRVI